MFKEGQKVWCSVWGWGKVVEVEDGDDYPVSVDFNSGDSAWFTAEGKFEDSGLRCLFFAEVIPQAAALNPPIEYPELFVGDVIIMVNDEIRVVVEYSSKQEKTFLGSAKAPKFLEDAYNRESFNKDFIKKVLGNIND